MTRIYEDKPFVLRCERSKIMIKGINHQMIELSETDNKYYERAFLIVRPEYAQVHRNVLEKEAKKMLKDVCATSVMKKKAIIFKTAVQMVIGGIVGAGVTVLVQLLFV